MFPFTLNLKVCFKIKGFWPEDRAETEFEWPFRYTIKSGRHYGLLLLGSARTWRRYRPTPVRKHFKEYGRVIANQVLKYYKEAGYGAYVYVRLEDEEWGLSGRFYYGAKFAQMGSKAYFILCNQYTNMLYDAVTLAASLHLEKIGYRPIRKPRKRITKNLCRWRNYKGLEFAEISGNNAVIRLDKQYEGSLLDIGILPEVIKHVNKRGCDVLLWYVNTSAQAVEAKLLVPDSEVSVHQPKEVETLPL